MCGRFSFASNLEELNNEFSSEMSSNFPAKIQYFTGTEFYCNIINENNFYINQINWGFKIPKIGKLVINASQKL